MDLSQFNDLQCDSLSADLGAKVHVLSTCKPGQAKLQCSLG